MWNHVESKVGLLNVLDRKIAERDLDGSFYLPRFELSDSIVVASDYSGELGTDPWSCLSFILIPGRSHNEWEKARVAVRRRYGLGVRRMAFAKLNDALKMAALPDFLRAIASCEGLLVSVLVRKDIRSLFEPASQVNPAKWGAVACANWKPRVLEKMLRVTHLAAFFIAGIVSPNQSVTWVTDHDAIAPNAARFGEMAAAFGHILSYYLGETHIDALRCSTTAAPTGHEVNLEVEDIAAVPDLAGGALVELFSAFWKNGVTLSDQPLPDPDSLSPKTRAILAWLRDANTLKHLIYTVKLAGNGQLEIVDADLRVQSPEASTRRVAE